MREGLGHNTAQWGLISSSSIRLEGLRNEDAAKSRRAPQHTASWGKSFVAADVKRGRNNMKEKKIAEKIAEITRKPPTTDAYKLAREERKRVENRLGRKLGKK